MEPGDQLACGGCACAAECQSGQASTPENAHATTPSNGQIAEHESSSHSVWLILCGWYIYGTISAINYMIIANVHHTQNNGSASSKQSICVCIGPDDGTILTIVFFVFLDCWLLIECRTATERQKTELELAVSFDPWVAMIMMTARQTRSVY